MPIVQKIKSALHRKSSVPEAPVQPVAPLAPAAVVAQPITSDALLAQKEVLAQQELNRQAMVGNGNVYDELAGSRSSRRNSLLVEETLLPAQTTFVQSAQRASLIREEPTIIQTIEKDVVIQERIHPVEKEEIQPIIYREREQLDVRQITQMMHETQIQPTLIEQRELAPEVREAIVERAEPIPENIILARTEVDALQRTQVVHAPIVEEIIKKTVIEEVQPVLERDVFVPTNVVMTQPVYEKIIEAPTVYREIRDMREVGTRSTLVTDTLVQEGYMNNNLAGQSFSSSSYEQRRLSQNYDQALLNQNLSASSYEGQRMLSNSERLSLNANQMNNTNMLATGQVLPQVQSSRPAYAYLPSNYVEARPQFIGTASEFQRSAGGLPQTAFSHAKSLPTVYPMQPMQQAQAPLAFARQ